MPSSLWTCVLLSKNPWCIKPATQRRGLNQGCQVFPTQHFGLNLGGGLFVRFRGRRVHRGTTGSVGTDPPMCTRNVCDWMTVPQWTLSLQVQPLPCLEGMISFAPRRAVRFKSTHLLEQGLAMQHCFLLPRAYVNHDTFHACSFGPRLSVGMLRSSGLDCVGAFAGRAFGCDGKVPTIVAVSTGRVGLTPRTRHIWRRGSTRAPQCGRTRDMRRKRCRRRPLRAEVTGGGVADAGKGELAQDTKWYNPTVREKRRRSCWKRRQEL